MEKSLFYRSLDPKACAAVAALSEDQQAALEADNNDHVAKPIDMNVIYSVLEKWLRGQKG